MRFCRRRRLSRIAYYARVYWPEAAGFAALSVVTLSLLVLWAT